MKIQWVCLLLSIASASALAAPSVALLQERASFALGASAEEIVIENVLQSGGMSNRYDFTATINGAVSKCYVTNALGNTSDAICSIPRKGVTCDALRKAAGHCQ